MSQPVPLSPHSLSHREQLAHSLATDISVFQSLNQTLLKKLKAKNLTLQKVGGQFLFENVFEVFAVVTEKSLGEAESIRNRIRTTLQKVLDWSLVHSSFAFLNKRKDIIAHLLDNLDSPLYFGFLFLLNCRLYNYILKVYQLQESGSLVSCQIGPSSFKEYLRVAVFHSPHGSRFAVLQKSSVRPSSGFLDDSIPGSFSDLGKFDQSDKRYINSVFNNFSDSPSKRIEQERSGSTFVRTMTEEEAEIQSTLGTNLGICPQIFVACSEYVRDKEIVQVKRKELRFLYHNIVKSVALQSCAAPAAESLRGSMALDKKVSSVLLDRKTSGSTIEVKEVSLTNSRFLARRPKLDIDLKNVQGWEDRSRQNIASMTNLDGFQSERGRLAQTYQIPKKGQHQLNSLISPRADALVFFKSKRQESSLNRETPSSASQMTYYNYNACPSMADIQDPAPPIGSLQKFQSVVQTSTADLSRKPQVLEYNSEIRVTGALKFYDEGKKFGFIIGDKDGLDIFFHFKDMELNGISEERLVKNGPQRFSYVEMKYAGRRPDSKKAVDIKVLF